MSGATMEPTTNASDLYQEYLKEKTSKNWKFWIVGNSLQYFVFEIALLFYSLPKSLVR